MDGPLLKHESAGKRFAGFGPTRYGPAIVATGTVSLDGDNRTVRRRLRAVCPSLPGVYGMIDRQGQLIYVGMSGRSLDPEKIEELLAKKKRKGIWERLNSHASGGRSGDKFCIYICDRLVLPGLSRAEIERVASGELNLDTRTRQFVRDHLQFRFTILPDGEKARSVETLARSGSTGGCKPLLNPL